MVDHTTLLQSVKTALDESGRLPSAITIVTTEIDSDGSQANLKLPVIEITPLTSNRIVSHNTDFVDYATDASGNQIGFIFQSHFEMEIEIDVWTAEGGGYDERVIGEQVRTALYEYDSQQLGSALPDPSDPSVSYDPITKFTLLSGQQANDLTMTPALRRWRQTAEVMWYEEINTADLFGPESYVTEVRSGDGQVLASEDETAVELIEPATVDGLELRFDATPNTTSAADT